MIGNFPHILGYTGGTTSVAATTHTLSYPSGVQPGELLLLIISATGSNPSTPNYWRGMSSLVGTLGTRMAYRYAAGEEKTTETYPGYAFSITTSTSTKISWIVLRCTKNSILNLHSTLSSTTGTTITPSAFRGGSISKNYTLLNLLALNLDALPTTASTGWSTVTSQQGSVDASSVFIQKREVTSTANSDITLSALSLTKSTQARSATFSLTNPATGHFLPRKWWDFQNSGFDLNSTLPSRGISMSFVGDGNNIQKIGINLRRTGTVTGNLLCKIYDHSGTYGTNSIPTGSALATATTNINVANLSTTIYQYEEFVFTTPFQTVSNQLYVFTLECSNISGGSVKIATSSNTTGFGNPSTSADLSTWVTGTFTSDLIYTIHAIQNETPYYFDGDFSRAYITNNYDCNGIEALGPYTTGFYGNLGTENISSADIDSSDAGISYVKYDVVFDATENKNVMRFNSIADWTGTTKTERAQFTIRLNNHAYLDNVIHTRTRMKFGADMEYFRQNYPFKVGYGSSSPTNWIDFFETWTEQQPNLDGNIAGSSRVSLTLDRAATPGTPFTWRLEAEFMQPASVEFNNWFNYTNTSVPVPIDTWFWIDYYMLKGDNSTGRIVIKITPDSGSTVTLFNITGFTYYEGYPEYYRTSWQPLKCYSSKSMLDWYTANGKEYLMYLSNIQMYNPNYSGYTPPS
jgi:hypothetical protein